MVKTYEKFCRLCSSRTARCWVQVGGVPVGVIPPAWTALGDTVTVESLASLAKEDPETIRTILAAYGLSLGGGAPARLTRLKKFLGTF